MRCLHVGRAHRGPEVLVVQQHQPGVVGQRLEVLLVIHLNIILISIIIIIIILLTVHLGAVLLQHEVDLLAGHTAKLLHSLPSQLLQ